MTAADCILGKAAAGRADEARARKAAENYESLRDEFLRRGHPSPDLAAAARLRDVLDHQRGMRKRSAFQQLIVQSDIQGRIESFEGDPLRMALAFLEFDPDGKAQAISLKAQREYIRGQAHARMDAVLERFRVRAGGLHVLSPGVQRRRKADLANIVRELHGTRTGDPAAKEFAEAVTDALEFLRQLGNASGMDIPKLRDFGLPQAHSREALNSVTADEWADFTLDRLDLAKMVDTDTGQPFTRERLREVLAGVYETIVTDGLNHLEPGFRVKGDLISRRSQARFLRFKDGDAWLQYHERFGKGTALDVLLGHIDGMAADIAALRVLGPSPEATISFMDKVVRKVRAERGIQETGSKGARVARRIGSGTVKLRDLYANVTGQNSVPDSETLANVLAANRNIITSAALGSAFLTAITDRSFSRATSELIGLPAWKVAARHWGSFVKQPFTQADQRIAVRTAFTADAWIGRSVAQARYLGEVVGPEWSRWVADTVLRNTWLTPWTNSGRTAFQIEFLGHMTDHAAVAFRDLPEELRQTFRRHGVTEADWDLYRSTPAWADDKTGAELIRPMDMAAVAEGAGPDFQKRFDASTRIQQMLLTETGEAIPEATSRARAAILGSTRPGTFVGDFLLRNGALFKSFPLTIIQTHLRRAVFANLTGAQRAKYIAHLVIGTTVMGALALQMGEITKGRDPKPMDPTTDEGRKFLLAALMKGGGLGVFGDFLFADQNRYGTGFAEFLAGPVLGQQITTATKLTIGTLQELAVEGEDRNTGREFVRLLRQMTPGRSAWYATLAFERMVFDEIQKQIDPDYASHFRRIEQRTRRNFGQDYFAPPGRGLIPERRPELGNPLR